MNMKITKASVKLRSNPIPQVTNQMILILGSLMITQMVSSRKMAMWTILFAHRHSTFMIRLK